MATTTSRLFLPYPVAADNNNVPADMGALAQDIDDKLCQVLTIAGRNALTARQGMRVWTSDGGGTSVPTESFRDASAWQNISRYSQGLRSARPAANSVLPGHLYWATDQYALHLSDASNWYRIGVQPGTVVDFLGNEGSVPAGYIVLYGQTGVTRSAEYTDLFAAWSTKYGAGNGSTTFDLPDTRGVVFADIDTHNASQISTANQRIGATSGTRHANGEITHTLITAEMPVHAHGFDWYYNNTFADTASGGYTGVLGQAVGSGSTYNAGSGNSHNNIQPTMTSVKMAKL